MKKKPYMAIVEFCRPTDYDKDLLDVMATLSIGVKANDSLQAQKLIMSFLDHEEGLDYADFSFMDTSQFLDSLNQVLDGKWSLEVLALFQLASNESKLVGAGSDLVCRG